MTKTNILLESGTNELEIVEFIIHNASYGINVAKVREIVKASDYQVRKVPRSHPDLLGIFSLRDIVIPLVDLARSLKDSDYEPNLKTQRIIVSEFNRIQIAFLVDSVLKIHRLSWKEILPPDELADNENQMITGIIRKDDKLILMLDYEKIVADIHPESSLSHKRTKEESNQSRMQKRQEKHIVIAEDSALLARLIQETLGQSGYSNITRFENGQLAWDYIHKLGQTANRITDEINLLITDIEMPQMDGHHLLKKVKGDDKLSSLPVFVFSSLINKQMYEKGKKLGADEQVSKPEIDKLIDKLDQFLLT